MSTRSVRLPSSIETNWPLDQQPVRRLRRHGVASLGPETQVANLDHELVRQGIRDLATRFELLLAARRAAPRLDRLLDLGAQALVQLHLAGRGREGVDDHD